MDPAVAVFGLAPRNRLAGYGGSCIAVSLVLGAACLIGTAPAYAQSLSADLQLLDKADRGDFGAIDRTRIALVDVMITLHAFTDASCIADKSWFPELGPAAERIVELTLQLQREHQDVMFTVGMLRTTSPNYMAAAVWLDRFECSTTRTQNLLANFIRLLGERNSARAWGIGVGGESASRESRVQSVPSSAAPRTARRDPSASLGSPQPRSRRAARVPPVRTYRSEQEVMEWESRCAAAPRAEGISSYLSNQWCTCALQVTGWLSVAQGEGLLRDYQRTINELRKSEPEGADHSIAVWPRRGHNLGESPPFRAAASPRSSPSSPVPKRVALCRRSPAGELLR